MTKSMFPGGKKFICPEKIVLHLYPEYRVPETGNRRYNLSRERRGRITGMSYHRYWCFLFTTNEFLPKDKKMTDFAIAKNVAMEFPNNRNVHRLFKEGDSYSVHDMRKSYNWGQLGNAYPRSKVPKGMPLRKGPYSFRYNSEGQALPPRLGARKPLTDKRIAFLLQKNRGLDENTKPPFSKLASKGLDCEKSCAYPLQSVPDSATNPPCPLNRKRCSRNCEADSEPTEAEDSTENG